MQTEGAPQTEGEPLWQSALLPLGILLSIAPVLLAGGLLGAIGNNATLAANLAAAFLIYLAVRPGFRELIAAIVASIVLRELYVKFYGPTGIYPGSGILTWCPFLGFSAIVMLGVRALGRKAGQRGPIEDFAAATLCLHGWIIFAYAMLATTRDLPRTMDGVLFSFDASLGFSPSFVLGSLLVGRPLLSAITSFQYQILFIIVLGVWAWKRHRGCSRNLLAAIICMLLVGFMLYYICPATGPAWAFPNAFPRNPPRAASSELLRPLLVAVGARNAMPSLHIGLCLLVWWASRDLGRMARVAVGIFLVATVFSTMALGEHYLVDIMVAAPYAVVIQAAMETRVPLASRKRMAAILVGAIVTAGWILSFRFGPTLLSWPWSVLWVLMISTVAASLTLEARLAAAIKSD
jgi:hypothetical protein